MLAALILLAGGAFAQPLPDCATLDSLWLSDYRAALKPDWPAQPLACGKADGALSKEEIRDLDAARAAFALDRTQWTDTSLPGKPLVAGGGVARPPNMLRWVSDRIRGLRWDAQAQSAYANPQDGTIHLTPADFKLESGIGLAGQLIHESRHLGHPAYGHVECAVPGQSGPNCDPTIAEDFDGGGSHAIAALWLAWVSNRSRWPQADRKQAEKVANWVLKYRINDREAADAFSCRYFGYYLNKAKVACRR